MFLLLHVAHAKKKTSILLFQFILFYRNRTGFQVNVFGQLEEHVHLNCNPQNPVIHLTANTFPVTLLPALMICSSEGGQNWGQQKIAAWESQVICIQDTEARYLQTKSKSTIFFQYSVLKITHLKTKQNKSLWLRHTI